MKGMVKQSGAAGVALLLYGEGCVVRGLQSAWPPSRRQEHCQYGRANCILRDRCGPSRRRGVPMARGVSSYTAHPSASFLRARCRRPHRSVRANRASLVPAPQQRPTLTCSALKAYLRRLHYPHRPLLFLLGAVRGLVLPIALYTPSTTPPHLPATFALHSTSFPPSTFILCPAPRL